MCGRGSSLNPDRRFMTHVGPRLDPIWPPAASARPPSPSGACGEAPMPWCSAGFSAPKVLPRRHTAQIIRSRGGSALKRVCRCLGGVLVSGRRRGQPKSVATCASAYGAEPGPTETPGQSSRRASHSRRSVRCCSPCVLGVLSPRAGGRLTCSTTRRRGFKSPPRIGGWFSGGRLARSYQMSFRCVYTKHEQTQIRFDCPSRLMGEWRRVVAINGGMVAINGGTVFAINGGTTAGHVVP